MDKLDLIHKTKLIGDTVWDLRQADYDQLLDIAKVYYLKEAPDACIKRSLTDAELMKLILNSHKGLSEKNNPFYIIDTETICRIVNSVQLFNRAAVDVAVKEIVANARMADDETPDKDTLIANLKCKNALLEEGMRSLILAKSVILPTADKTQLKKVNEELAIELEQAVADKQKAELRARTLERKLENIKNEVF